MATTLDSIILHVHWPIFISDNVSSDKVALFDLAGKVQRKLIIACGIKPARCMHDNKTFRPAQKKPLALVWKALFSWVLAIP